MFEPDAEFYQAAECHVATSVGILDDVHKNDFTVYCGVSATSSLKPKLGVTRHYGTAGARGRQRFAQQVIHYSDNQKDLLRHFLEVFNVFIKTMAKGSGWRTCFLSWRRSKRQILPTYRFWGR